MCVGLDRQAKGSGETEIGQLDRLTVLADKQILRLKIAVENAVRVQENESLRALVEEALSLFRRECRTLLLHVLLQIILKVLEDQIELVLGEKHFLKSANG